MTRTTEDGIRKVDVRPESITMEGPGNIRYVDISSVHHSILHLNRQEKSTLVGANLVNMGRRDYHPDSVHEYENNVVVGTDAGNVRGGLQRSIIIGSNIVNGNPNVFQGEKVFHEFVTNHSVDMPHYNDMPAVGVFAIGFDDEPLLSGNFDSRTLNLPDLDDLQTTLAKVAQNGAAKVRNVVFENRGILMTVNKVCSKIIALLKNPCLFYTSHIHIHTQTPTMLYINVYSLALNIKQGEEKDSVQDIFDTISGLKDLLCNSENGTAKQHCPRKWLLPKVIFAFHEDMGWTMECKYQVRHYDSASNTYTTVLSVDYQNWRTEQPLIYVNSDFYVEETKFERVPNRRREFTAMLEGGTYFIEIYDYYGDTWGCVANAHGESLYKIDQEDWQRGATFNAWFCPYGWGYAPQMASHSFDVEDTSDMHMSSSMASSFAASSSGADQSDLVALACVFSIAVAILVVAVVVLFIKVSNIQQGRKRSAVSPFDEPQQQPAHTFNM